MAEQFVQWQDSWERVQDRPDGLILTRIPVRETKDGRKVEVGIYEASIPAEPTMSQFDAYAKWAISRLGLTRAFSAFVSGVNVKLADEVRKQRDPLSKATKEVGKLDVGSKKALMERLAAELGE